MTKTALLKNDSESLKDFAILRKHNARYLKSKIVPYHNGDGLAAYVIKKHTK